MSPTRRIILLPGMGADGRLFPEVWDALPGVVRVDWSECAGATTLGEAAEKLIRRHGIGPADRLVGISLGGMVACEIASRLRIASPVLIASTTHPRGVSRFLRLIHPLMRIVPLVPLQVALRYSPNLVHRMFARTDPGFLRAMVKAIFRWEGLSPAAELRPVRLHGRRDLVIPRPAGPARLFDGGHMFMVRDAAGCVAATAESFGLSGGNSP